MTATPAAPYVDLMTERLAVKGAETVLRYQRCDISAAELQASIRRYARALAGLGIGRGDLVALFATNSPDAIAIRYASHLAGAAGATAPSRPSRANGPATLGRVPGNREPAGPRTVAHRVHGSGRRRRRGPRSRPSAAR